MYIDTILVDKRDKKGSWSLFGQIDNKVAYISDMAINNIRFGLTTSINYQLYEDLVFYRDVLRAKLCNSSCFCDVSEKRLVSKIKSLLNQIC